jgi:PEP-CTERM motif
MTRHHLLCLTLLLAIAVPFAAADTIQLTTTNLPGISNIGTVTLTQGVGGVMVTLTANSGFSFKTHGGDILFNTNATLNAGSISQITINGVAYNGNFAFGGPATRAGSSFDFNLSKLNPKGVGSATTISFFVSGVTVQQLSGAWGVHFCVGTDCSGLTGFASSGQLTAVPEPGTLTLLGTGIVALAGIFRRRFLS